MMRATAAGRGAFGGAALAAAACSADPHADLKGGGVGSAAAADSGIEAEDTASEPAADYSEDGPVPFEVIAETVETASGSVDVTVYLPTAPGPHPVVGFSCGSEQTAAGYVPYGERLASHGIALVLMDDPGVFVNTGDIVPRAVYVVGTWLAERFPAELDLERVGLAGHSRGGAVSLLAAEHGLAGTADAWFGLDPVDNEFLMAPSEYARDDLPKITIPTGFLGAEIGGSCAPAADGYQALYPLAPAPSVLVVGLGAGHTQLEVPEACTACEICTPDGTADPAVVLGYATRYFAAFFGRELLGDAAVGAAFEGAGGPEDVAAGLVTIESR